MSNDYSFVEIFVTKVNDPDVFDAVGAPVSGVDQFFTELGKIAKAIQDKTLTAGDAQAAKAILLKFSDGINRLNARIAQVGGAVGNAQDAQFKAFFNKLAVSTNLAIQQVTYAADEIAAGRSASIQKFGVAASSILKNVGGFLGLIQIGNEFKENGLTAVGVDKAGEKALGVIAGLAGGELAALAAGGLALALGGSALVVAAVAIGAAVGVGYVVSKAGEALWEPFRYVYEQQFLPSVFSAGTTAYNTVTTGLSDLSIQMGKFDGTWLEGLDGVSAQDKAAFTSLMSGIAKIPATAALNADIKKLFSTNFTEEALVGRDLLLKSLLTFAKDNGYAIERVTANAANVTLDFPRFPTTALISLRDYAQKLLSSIDQAGWSLTGPSRIVLATGAGTHAASDKDSLLVGSSGVDGLIGDAGDDDLIGDGGADILLGGAGTDDLFGGADDDVLDGGDGSDYLHGGTGIDQYKFTGAFGGDTVIDSDGQGSIEIDGVTLQGGKKLDDKTWYNKDQGYVFVLSGSGDSAILSIRRDSSLNVIRVRGWQNGHLGLTMDDAPIDGAEIPPILNADRTIGGDFALLDTDLATEGLQTGADDLGNLLTLAGQVEADRADTLYDSAGNDWLQGKGGADILYATRGGDDHLEGGGGNDYADGGAGRGMVEGGDGDDRLDGGTGNDTLMGGADKDIIQGGDDDDHLYGNLEVATDVALAQGHTQIGTQQKGDWLNGGNGDDVVIAGADNDALFGGTGDDVLIGGAGDDVLDGDDDYTADNTGWTATALNGNPFNSHFSPVQNNNTWTEYPGEGGADVLYGGAGNDRLHGLWGNDLLFGDEGNDVMSGDEGDDLLFGGTGNDMMTGDSNMAAYADGTPVGQGDDYFDGGDGDDTLLGRAGSSRRSCMRKLASHPRIHSMVCYEYSSNKMSHRLRAL